MKCAPGYRVQRTNMGTSAAYSCVSGGLSGSALRVGFACVKSMAPLMSTFLAREHNGEKLRTLAGMLGH